MITDPNKVKDSPKVKVKKEIPKERPKPLDFLKEKESSKETKLNHQKIREALQKKEPAPQEIKPETPKENHTYEYSLEEATSKKKLSNKVLIFVLINAILGSSLFYLPGLGVSSSGPASILAWVFVFIFAIFVATYIGELTTAFPSSGGTYAFCKRAYGRFFGFQAGWLIWIAGNLGMALNIVAAAQYFIPEAGPKAFLLQITFSFVWIIVLNFMAYRGIDAGVSMLVAFGGFSIAVVTFSVLPSFISIPDLLQGVFLSPFDTARLAPFFAWEGASIIPYMLFSIFLLIEAFFGFETITYLSNEAKDVKSLHKVLRRALIICGLIVVVYIFASLGTVSLQDYVSDARPFAVQAFNNMGQFGEDLIVFGMYLVIIGTAAAWPITSSRLLQAMAKDKLFLKQLAKRHKKHKSPYRAVLFQTVFILVFTWFIFRGYLENWGDSYRTFYLIYVLLGLLLIGIIVLTVPILRKRSPTTPRPYYAPFPKLGPALIIGFFALLVINWIHLEGSLAWSIIRLASSFIIIGIPFYFLVEMYYDPKAILKVNESLSWLVLATEKIHFPSSMRRKILDELGDIQGKKVLEYGSSIGSLTTRLAPMVGHNGKITATDLSLHNAKIVNKRTKDLAHVTVFHHPHLDRFDLGEASTSLAQQDLFDLVISVGQLSLMQKPKKILKDLSYHLKKDAAIVFVDYDKFFYLIPNVDWIESKEQLVQVFKEAGFNIEVRRKRSLFWTYIIITGWKE